MKKYNFLINDRRNIIFYSALIALFCMLLWMIAKPYFGVRYNYSVGDISGEDIISPRDITYVNTKETEKRVIEVRNRATVIFDFKEFINDNIFKRLDGFLTLIEEVSHEELTDEEKVDRIYEKNFSDFDEGLLINFLINHEEQQYSEKLKSTISFVLNNGLSALNKDQLLQYSDKGIILKRIKETEITQEKVEVAQITAGDEVLQTVNEYVVENFQELNAENVRVLVNSATNFLKPNIFYNNEESIKLVNEEVRTVRPVLNTIKKGAIVIRRGEEINDENFPKLEAITLYTSNFNLKAIVGIGILLLILLFLSTVPFFDEGMKIDLKKYLVLVSFTLFTVFYAYLLTLIKNLPHYIVFSVFIPIAGITMNAEVLYKRRFSLTLALVLPVFLMLISGNDPYTFIFSIGSGLIAIYAVKNAEKRSDILKSSLFIVITNELILTAVGLLKELNSREFITLLTWGAGNGIFSVVLSLGTIPFFEILLNIPTNFRLLELSDLNNPMMKRIQIEAPGTYHHSINVANMAENAARYIKANPLIVRVAALYHDIGKIPNAQYYIENSNGESLHNLIKPSLSNSILKAHIKIGVEMANSIKLPKEVIDVIEQHHGTSLMKYFYYQALEKKDEGTEIDKHDYHYPGPKPQTREAAIVMLADTIEAASRTLQNPSAKRIEELVNEIIESKFREGQFNESSLTLRGLMKISIAFRRYLTGVYHSRIEYPDEREIKKTGQEK
ncbi:MAG: HDIG domain-containing protein [Spirochaetes bacterium]|nr:HDIG domain-containing protein [Spirochaetota bacterium]